MRPLADNVGKRYGRLTVLLHRRERKAKWQCRCDCGAIVEVASVQLRNGHTQSCGCLRREITRQSFTTHGKSNTAIYRHWADMIKRCTNPNNVGYQKWYGVRGIGIDDQRWFAFEEFYADMGDPPSRKHSLDRIDNNRGYSKANCRWATATEQQRNKRPIKLTEVQVLAIRSDSRSQRAIADSFGISQSAVSFIKCGKRWAHITG